MSHVSTSDHRLPASAERLLERVRQALLDTMPAGWQLVRIDYTASVLMNQSAITGRMADGTTPAVFVPAVLEESMVAVRASMYEPDRGTWFSARLTLSPPEELHVEFNFDADPEWWPSVPARLFVCDLDAFPRSREHIPDWLTEKLAEAAAEQKWQEEPETKREPETEGAAELESRQDPVDQVPQPRPGPDRDSAGPRRKGPKRLIPAEQEERLQAITAALLKALPPDWRKTVICFRSVGKYIEVDTGMRIGAGPMRLWEAPESIWRPFVELRWGMHVPDRGTWHSAKYVLEHPDHYTIHYDRGEPDWVTPPSAQAYRDELRFFARPRENVPDWFQDNAS
jgi:hypothetical protein